MKIHFISTADEEVDSVQLHKFVDDLMDAGWTTVSDPSAADLIILTPGVKAKVAVINPKVPMLNEPRVESHIQTYRDFENFVYRNLWK